MTNKELQEKLKEFPDDYKIILALDSVDRQITYVATIRELREVFIYNY